MSLECCTHCVCVGIYYVSSCMIKAITFSIILIVHAAMQGGVDACHACINPYLLRDILLAQVLVLYAWVPTSKYQVPCELYFNLIHFKVWGQRKYSRSMHAVLLISNFLLGWGVLWSDDKASLMLNWFNICIFSWFLPGSCLAWFLLSCVHVPSWSQKMPLFQASWEFVILFYPVHVKV